LHAADITPEPPPPPLTPHPHPQSATLAGSPYHEEPQQVWPRMRQWLAMALQLWPPQEQLHPCLLALKDKVRAGFGVAYTLVQWLGSTPF
jgi:hypothetical protein